MPIPVIQQELIAEVRVRRITRQAKFLRRGDVIVFDPTSNILQALRPSTNEMVLISQCSWIYDQKSFQNIVNLLGLQPEMKLTVTVQDSSVPKALWSRQFV